MRKRGETGRSRLKGDGAYDDREIKRITAAIANHSDKHHIHNDYDELLKDADVMDHCFYNSDFPVSEWEKAGTIIFLQKLGSLRSMSDFTKFHTHEIVHCKGEKDPAEFSVKLDRQKEMGSAVKRQKFQFSIEIFPVFR